MISEEMLRSAAAESRTIFVAHLEQDFDPACAHTFSPSFMRKIKKLTRQTNHPVFYRGLQRVASVFLAMLIGASVWLSVDTQARAAFVQWVREVYEEYILYRYFNAPQYATLPAYEITALPDGYTLTDSITNETSCIQIFEQGDSEILFLYRFVSSDTQTEIFLGDYQYESIQFGPVFYDFYAPEDKKFSNELLWFDNQNHIEFQLSSFLGKAEMVEIAASVTRQKN